MTESAASLMGPAEASREGDIPLSPSLKQKARDGLVALSLSNLFLVKAWHAALYGPEFGYFNKLRVGPITLLALLTNLAWVTAAGWLALQAWRRWGQSWARLWIELTFLVMLLAPVDFCRAVFAQCPWSTLIPGLKGPVGLTSVGLIVGLIVWQHGRVARWAAVLVGILSPLAIFILTRVVLVLAGIEHLAQPGGEPALAPVGPVREGQPRVVWMIFDETDQRLAFEQRPAGLKMPEFDRLLGECLSATNAYPPGDRTMLSMPALISGERLLKADVKNASDLEVVLADGKATNTWSRLPSVFASARQIGVNTALVGWYHPYHRVLGSGLNLCQWYPWPEVEPIRGPGYWDTIERQLLCLGGPFNFRRLYRIMSCECLESSLEVVTNETYGLVFLHLPPPHKPGIFNRATGRYTVALRPDTTEYFDNLALADRFLGALRGAMEASGQWKKCWVIVSSDHSWRWSQHYDGCRDKRVPFLVKAPGQTKGKTYPARMNTILTHDLVLAILSGQLHGQPELEPWLESHRTEAPTIVDRSVGSSQ